MQLDVYVVDAFAREVFTGNPAAVVPLSAWLDDAVMQAIAAENNLSETAFFLPEQDPMPIRWFTPKMEVPLCGHATLATAHVVKKELERKSDVLRFMSRERGELGVAALDDGRLQLDFPAYSFAPLEDDVRATVERAVGCEARAAVVGDKFTLLELESEEAVSAVRPNFGELAQHERFVIVTAPGNDHDFVSRFFAPAAGIDEDPVTGSAHCLLVPYWSRRLDKTAFAARQISERGGELGCVLSGERVLISGNAVTYMRGQLTV